MARTNRITLLIGLLLPMTHFRAEAAEPIFRSEVVSAKTNGHAVEIDVLLRDAKKLYLVVSDAGDGITCDFANWAHARFVTQDKEIDLRELKWLEARTSWGEIKIDINAEEGPMRINGRPVRGIGTHANSLIAYSIPKGARRFRALAGLDTQGTDEGLGSTVRFLIFTEKPDFDVEPFRFPDQEDGGSGDRPVGEFDAMRFFGAGEDQTGRATTVDNFRLANGFRAELIYTVPLETQGSWVSLATDPKGRLLASDQRSGLYRVTLPSIDQSLKRVHVERLDVEIGGAQGLLCAHGGLYAVVNGDESGLYRVTDTNGDDQYDHVELLRRIDGGGEHGPHAVVLGPRGESLYLVGGNDCFPETFPEKSRVPRVWQEDRLLSRTGASDGPWGDGRHGGWICRSDRHGKQLELIAMGLRNPYDIAFNQAGELFTFDADMEWDVGTPWYRPNRVNHVVSGADFGWRAGTSKWPDYFFDSFGSVVDVGLSSPTGVVFGYDARFPTKYRRAFFIADWSLGNIYAVHLEPDGASYTGEFESFVTGAPLPVTDLVVNARDGAMYFTVGGRGITSALYRITYEGGERLGQVEIRPADTEEAASRQLRAIRRRLEQHHSRHHHARLKDVLPSLSHSDRAIRFAARVALEHVPRQLWTRELGTRIQSRTMIAAALAGARHGESGQMPTVLESLERMRWSDLSRDDRIDLLRTYTVILSRHGRDGQVGSRIRREVCGRLSRLFPCHDPLLDQQLAEILTFVDAPQIIDRILDRLEDAETQEAQIHYAMCLRDIDRGWSLDQRRRQFKWFQRTVEHRGGVLFGDYIWQIRSVSEGQLSDADRGQLVDVLKMPIPSDPLAGLAARKLVREWSVMGLLEIVDGSPGGGKADDGRRIFKSALCLNCHRVHGQGAMVGPDLSSVTRRFNTRDLLEAIIEPDKVISDQYRKIDILTDDGRQVTGKITDINGNTLVLMNDPFNPADLSMVKRDTIDALSWSRTSSMPRGLLNTFTSDEVLDLIAFLHRAGDSQSTSTEARE